MNVPHDFISDGCTFPGPFALLRGILGGDRYNGYCREHDFLRRHKVINWLRADTLLFRHIFSDGVAGKLRAPFYFLFVVVSRVYYRRTVPLPERWKKYAEFYQ